MADSSLSDAVLEVRAAEVPWKIQQLPDEDAFEHRVRVVKDVLAAVEKAESEMLGLEMLSPGRPSRFETDREWAEALWFELIEARDRAADATAMLEAIETALKRMRADA